MTPGHAPCADDLQRGYDTYLHATYGLPSHAVRWEVGLHNKFTLTVALPRDAYALALLTYGDPYAWALTLVRALVIPPVSDVHFGRLHVQADACTYAHGGLYNILSQWGSWGEWWSR